MFPLAYIFMWFCVAAGVSAEQGNPLAMRRKQRRRPRRPTSQLPRHDAALAYAERFLFVG